MYVHTNVPVCCCLSRRPKGCAPVILLSVRRHMAGRVVDQGRHMTHANSVFAPSCCVTQTATPLGAACAAAPPRRRSRVRPACRRARIHACEQLCAVSMMCRVCIWVRRALLLLHDDAAGYVMLVAVCAYTHTSSCALSPWRAAYVQGCSWYCDAPGGILCCLILSA